ncbi:MAG: DUF4292 domain-containing protein [Dysgonamonadaceae bacterium]|jgi:hypothetical protein|nr:DUF4292 domain-containing protein [Dysgonamonadaceae bacterium]
MSNSKRITVLLLIGILLGGYSCRSVKETSIVALQKMSKTERLNAIISSELQYHTFSSNLKFAARIGKQKKEVTVDALLRIIKNEAIQLSLRIPLLGTEAFKIIITPDQILIVDRLNKQYLSETMKNVQTRVPFDLDYYSLEALLTNRMFIAGAQKITPENYTAFNIKENDFLVNLINTNAQGIQYDFTIDHSHRIQLTQMNRKKGQSYLQCKYSEWGFASNRNYFPLLIDLALNVPNDTYKVNLSFKSVDINTDFKIDLDAPNSSKYQQVSLPQVIELIKNLL